MPTATPTFFGSLRKKLSPSSTPTPSPPTQPTYTPRTTSLLPSDVIPLYHPKSQSKNAVPRGRICAVRELSGRAVIISGWEDEGFDGGIMGDTTVKGEELQIEGTFDEFVGRWCVGFLVLEEVVGYEDETKGGSRIAINTACVTSILPDVASQVPGCVVVDFGPGRRNEVLARTRKGVRKVRVCGGGGGGGLLAAPSEEEEEKRVLVKVKGMTMAEMLLKVEPVGWEDVGL
ncbi:hypothetical protein HDV00_003498 [Rhizophlyctis rosea]|nr:hypothetical protein HDV00_003498 [Rhizophlyctis rosea]